jgi:ADP-ribose pyrophosphatase YjhB (NUDIX family)
MTEILYGDRITLGAELYLSVCAVLYDATRTKILLIQRGDNHKWALPGGGMEAGESVAEGCVREVFEETGLTVRVVGLFGVYSTPHRVLVSANGRRRQMVALLCKVELVSGEFNATTECAACGYFGRDDLAGLALSEHHQERIEDVLAQRPAPVIR